MTWNWYNIEKETTSQRLKRRQLSSQELDNMAGKKGAILDIKGPATDKEIQDRKDAFQDDFKQGLRDARKEKIVSAGKKVANVPKKIAEGVQSAGVKAIDRATAKNPRTASSAELDERFKNMKRRGKKQLEQRNRPIDIKAVKERQSKRYKDGRNPKLT